MYAAEGSLKADGDDCHSRLLHVWGGGGGCATWGEGEEGQGGIQAVQQLVSLSHSPKGLMQS
jgi:hypothetical protein